VPSNTENGIHSSSFTHDDTHKKPNFSDHDRNNGDKPSNAPKRAEQDQVEECMQVVQKTMSSNSNVYDWTPLVLSLLAGLSTCLGASVVFCAQRRSSKGDKPLSNRHLSFSLALAGSVMVTVSFFSLLPESFAEDSETFILLQPVSLLFWLRVAWFVAGCGLYYLLSKCAFPEPDALLGLQDEAQNKEEEKLLPSSNSAIVDSKTRTKHQNSVVVKRQSSVVTIPEKNLQTSRTSTLSDHDTESQINTSVDDEQLGSDGMAFWSKFSSGADLTTTEARRSWRVAMLLFVSLAVHNFPEVRL
jgi:zinc transporter ZupT